MHCTGEYEFGVFLSRDFQFIVNLELCVEFTLLSFGEGSRVFHMKYRTIHNPQYGISKLDNFCRPSTHSLPTVMLTGTKYEVRSMYVLRTSYSVVCVALHCTLWSVVCGLCVLSISSAR